MYGSERRRGTVCPSCEDGLLSSEDSEEAQNPIWVSSHLVSLTKASRWHLVAGIFVCCTRYGYRRVMQGTHSLGAQRQGELAEMGMATMTLLLGGCGLPSLTLASPSLSPHPIRSLGLTEYSR